MKKNKNKRNIIIIGIVIGIVLCFGLYPYFQPKKVVQKPAAMKRFEDPDHYYTVNIPGNWMYKNGVSQGTLNAGTSEQKSQKIEITQYYSEANKIGITVQVYEGFPVCNPAQKDNTTFAGVPAYYEHATRMWVIDSTTGTYVINYFYPGLVTVGRKTPAPVFSSTQKAQAETLLKKVVNTFVPKNTTAQGC